MTVIFDQIPYPPPLLCDQLACIQQESFKISLVRISLPLVPCLSFPSLDPLTLLVGINSWLSLMYSELSLSSLPCCYSLDA